MKLHFLGAAQEVTGSLLLVELEEGRLLVDCGLFQGRRQESRERNRSLPRVAREADAVVLTHAHLDHSGSLPTLVRDGFGGVIHCTPATGDLLEYMLRDSARIQESDAQYLNRKHADDAGWDPIVPLYSEQDVERALRRLRPAPYHVVFSPLPEVRVTFRNSGHILGSAQVLLDYREGGARRRVLISGDLGRRGLPIIRDPELPEPPIDYLVLESTYGNRLHESTEQMQADLERVVNATAKRGGKVVVPAFAVGRTQELLYVLHELSKAKRIPALPIFIDSPLAINVTEVFRQHPECYDAETRALFGEHQDVFEFPGVQIMRTPEESMQINTHSGPAIIISASGMAEAGRILHHLRNNISDARATILIVGFMAQHTLGRRLVEHRPTVKIWGIERDVHASIEVLSAFSAHADQADLMAYADACGPLRRCFLVHGEPEQQEPLARALAARGTSVEIPSRGQVIALD